MKADLRPLRLRYALALAVAVSLASAPASAQVAPSSSTGGAASGAAAGDAGSGADGSSAGAPGAGAASVYDATASAAASDPNYVIRPGDVVSVNVYGEPSLTEPASRVGSDGSVGMPLVGPVKIAGLAPRAASLAVDRALGRFLRHPVATVSILQIAPIQVLVLGAVRAPSRYALAPNAHLLDAIAAAGGLTPIDGDLPEARLETSSSAISTVSLQKLLHDDDLALNVPLQNGMTVYVPSPNTFQVQVAGAVDHSGDITVREGDRLSMAIARAGVSASSNADLNDITFRRVDGGKVESRTINLYKVLASNDLAQDPVLQKNDYIAVPKARTGAAAGGGAMSVLYLLSGLVPRI